MIIPTQRGNAGRGRFAVGVKEALPLQLSLDLLKGQLERPCAHRLDVFCDNLHLAALFVDRQPAAQQDVQAILRTEAKQPGLAAEKHHRELGRIIL